MCGGFSITGSPDIALVAESEIWPNTIVALDQRHIPLVLVNARMSDRSFRRWQKLPRIIGALLERYALCLAQTEDDAERLAILGAPRVVVTGNLKFDSPPPPADPRVVAHLSGLHRGSAGLVCGEHPSGRRERDPRRFTGRSRNAIRISLPSSRHAIRTAGAEIAGIAESHGLRASQRSDGIPPDRRSMSMSPIRWARWACSTALSPIVIMGGSLIAHGGQNPIEPAKLGAAILHGPHIHNFEEIYASIGAARGALMVKDSASLARAVSELLSNTALTRDMARAASDAVQALGGAVDRTMQSIEPFIVHQSWEHAADASARFLVG